MDKETLKEVAKQLKTGWIIAHYYSGYDIDMPDLDLEKFKVVESFDELVNFSKDIIGNKKFKLLNYKDYPYYNYIGYVNGDTYGTANYIVVYNLTENDFNRLIKELNTISNLSKLEKRDIKIECSN